MGREKRNKAERFPPSEGPKIFNKKKKKKKKYRGVETNKKCICRHCAACGASVARDSVGACEMCHADMHLY